MKSAAGGWFAAGAGFERALHRLGDPAFKVFSYICLRAERGSGCLEFERGSLARELGQSRSTLGRCLRELVAQGICTLEAAPNQHRRSRLRVCAEYWPYEAQPGDEEVPGASQPNPDLMSYVARVRELFLQPTCVQATFRTVDERLAAQWYRAGVDLERVEQAILLGSVRKSLALLEDPDGEPVRSLAYFRNLLEELREHPFPLAYGEHLERHLAHCEQCWRERPELAPGSAGSDLAPARPGKGSPRPASEADSPDRETGG